MAIQYTPTLGLPYPEVTDAPLIASRDLRALAQKMDSEGAQIRGESSAALTAGQAAEALAAQALARANAIEDPIHVGPDEPTDGEELWVDTDEDGGEGTQVSAADIIDATAVGRNVLTAPLAVNARNALDIWTGTRALLDEGTDTAERTWDAKELHEYVTDQVAAGGGAASWDDLTGKPETFPPSAHTHDDRYYTEAEVDAKIADALTALTPYSSGLREIGHLLTGYVSGSLTLLRASTSVQLSMRGLVLASGTSGEIYRLPDGFKPAKALIWNQREDFAASGPRVNIEQTGALNFVGVPTGTKLYSTRVYLTLQDPPPQATLPGDPA